jgi:hypothetical protein
MSIQDRIGNLRRFAALSWADRWLIVRAAYWLLVARILILAIPFQHLAARLSAKPGGAQPDPDPAILDRIGYAVSVAAARVPWRSDCFPQTIAARMLMKRHGLPSRIHLGVERVGDEDLLGHAWLTCGDELVVGGADLERYTEIHRFEA